MHRPMSSLPAATAAIAAAAIFAALACAWAAAGPAAPAPAAGRPAAEAGAARPLKAVVIAGGHGYPEKEFPKVFEGNADIACTFFTEKVGGEAYDDISKWDYDAIALYNFNRKLTDAQQANLLKLLEKGVGLVVLHHAIAAYPDWPEWPKIFGARYYLKDVEEGGVKHARSGWKHDVDFKVRIADAAHPVTKGVADFAIHDETYCRFDVDPKVHVLLTTDEPTSEKNIGWTKTYAKARVCFIVLGHDEKAYASKEYRTLVAQAIRWTAGRL
ncbi:MAG: ThuA domain-containing protein [Planctomycetes bacterium]|nr:ThuA domain-containing protein [Planctomycetota bacterium]